MKVALCFIISYKHIVNKETLWINWIKENSDIINVYFHYKDINQITSPWIKSHCIPPLFIQPTSYYNVVPAYMSILSYAYRHDNENMWFCMLTESCVPIISPEKFRAMFYRHSNQSIIKCQPAYWNVMIHRRANLRLLREEFRLANDPWFTLCRNHVGKCLMYSVCNPKLFCQINNGGLANESIFAIILQTFGEKNSTRLINSSSSVADWTRMSSATSPYLFTHSSDENVNIICKLLKENTYAMFLRKVDKEFPDDDIQKIMKLDVIGLNVKHPIMYTIIQKLICIIQKLLLFSGLFWFTSSFTKIFLNR